MFENITFFIKWKINKWGLGGLESDEITKRFIKWSKQLETLEASNASLDRISTRVVPFANIQSQPQHGDPNLMKDQVSSKYSIHTKTFDRNRRLTSFWDGKAYKPRQQFRYTKQQFLINVSYIHKPFTSLLLVLCKYCNTMITQW